MGFITRLKKLTNYVYSPTTPASEDAIRSQIDDSIQEVYDDVQTGLAATDGASLIGYSGGYATVEVALQAFESGGSGTIPPDGSITNGKLATDVKVGSLASLDTTVKTDVVSAINEVNTNADENAVNLDIARTAILDTGVADAYVVDTAGTFDLTLDGNMITFIPSNNNTGASTFQVDSQTVKAIKDVDDTGAFIDLEADKIKENVPTQLVWSVGSDFFILRPSGGVKRYGTSIVGANTPSDTTSLRLNLSGKGVFKGITSPETTAFGFYFELDGVRYPSSGNYESLGFSVFFDMPFKTSFVFYSEDTRVLPIYDLNKTLAIVPASTSAISPTLRVDVTGKGRLKDFVVNGSFALEVDGVFVVGNTTSVISNVNTRNTYITDFEFQTSFKLYTTTNQYICTYELY